MSLTTNATIADMQRRCCADAILYHHALVTGQTFHGSEVPFIAMFHFAWCEIGLLNRLLLSPVENKGLKKEF